MFILNFMKINMFILVLLALIKNNTKIKVK
jgi:hypothetical protein